MERNYFWPTDAPTLAPDHWPTPSTPVNPDHWPTEDPALAGEAPQVISNSQPQYTPFETAVLEGVDSIKKAVENQKQPLSMPRKLILAISIIAMSSGAFVGGVEYARNRFISAADVITSIVISDATREGKPAACSYVRAIPPKLLPKATREFCGIKNTPVKTSK